MLSGKASSCALASVFVALVVLALAPWGISAVFDPMRPNELEETAQAYQPTEEAFGTREAQIEKSATSDFEVWTPEYDAYLQSVTATSNVDIVVVPDTITGVAAQELPIFRCPYPSDQTETLWPANQEFTVLGWNTDLDNTVYFLIEDDPARPQVWVRLKPGVSLSFSDYELIYPVASGCRTWTTEPSLTTTPAVQDGAVTPTIPLPAIRTATPLPPEPVRIELTDEEATAQVEQDIPDLDDPSVRFTPDEVRITGKVEASTLLGDVTGTLDIRGTLEMQDSKLYLNMTSVTVRGRNYTDKEEGQQAENAVNAWLAKLLIRREVQSFELGDGVLIIDVLEHQESILPPLAPTVSPMPAAEEEAEQVDSITPMPSPLPEAHPITPTPRSMAPIEISSSQATVDAINNLSSIMNPNVSFTSSGVVVVGQIAPPVEIPGLATLATARLVGRLVIQNGQLQIEVQELTLNGASVAQPTLQTALEGAVNIWLPTLQNGMPITNFSLSDGFLTLSP